VTTGVALVGASAIAIAPVAPITMAAPAKELRAVHVAVSPEFQLTALDIPYILTLPIVRQQIRNWAETWAVYLAGLAKAGVGAAQSLLAIPGVTAEIIQEVLTLNFVGAFDTFATAVRDSVVAVGAPLLDSLIWRNQKALAVQTALQAAVPQALIDVANGFLAAGNGVVTALIEGTQAFVGAVLTLNLSNIITAAIDGTRSFIVALGAGAGAIVAGIEAAQLGISTALATEPPTTTATNVSDVTALRTMTADTTVSLAGGAESAAGDTAESPVETEPVNTPIVTPPVAEEVETPVASDVPEAPQEPTGATPFDEEPKGLADDDVQKEAEDAGTKDSGVTGAEPKDAETKDTEAKDDAPKKDTGSANDDAGESKSGSDGAE
jgi:hypothetical protein